MIWLLLIFRVAVSQNPLLSISINGIVEGKLFINQIYTLSVSNNGGKNFNNETISIYLNPAGCFDSSTITTKNAIKGTKSLNFNINITCENNFTLTATASANFSESNPLKITAIKNFQKITLNCPTTTTTVQQRFTFTAELYGSDGSLWGPKDVLNITCIGCDVKIDIISTYLQYDGTPVTLTIVFKDVGTKILQVSSTQASANVSITVVPIGFCLNETSIPDETYSTKSFPVKVFACDSQGNLINDIESSVQVYLMLQCQYSDECSGTKLTGGYSIDAGRSLEWGLTTFPSVTVLSSGSLELCAVQTKTDKPLGFCKMITGHNNPKYVSISFDSKVISAFTYFNVNYTVLGEDNGVYFGAANVSFQEVTVSGRELIGGNISVKYNWSESSLSEATLYFSNYGTKKIRGRIGSVYSDSASITVKPNYINATSVSTIPKTSRDPFIFQVFVYDNAGSALITEIDVDVIVSTYPESNTAGKTVYKTHNGVANIDNFLINSEGDFNLIITVGTFSKVLEASYYIQTVDCDISYGPIVTMILLGILGIFMPAIFISLDSRQRSFNYVRFKVLAIHPVTGLFYKQPNYRRALLSMQLAASGLVLLAVIGGIYGYYDSPTTHYNRTYTEYKNKEIYKGATAWALSQVVSVSLFYLNFRLAEHEKLIRISAVISFILISLSTGAIIGMTVKYCLGYFVFWIVNFMIFIFIDWFLFFTLYSFICLCLLSPMLKGEMESVSSLKLSSKYSSD